MLDSFQFQMLFRLLFASFLGALIGLEREHKRKEAGLKTFSLVALGACLFTIIGVYLASPGSGFSSSARLDPTRVIQAVAIGIGFIGSGLIIFHKFQVEGLTTAAALWATAAVGAGMGFGLCFLSASTAFLTILILFVFRKVEERVFHKK